MTGRNLPRPFFPGTAATERVEAVDRNSGAARPVARWRVFLARQVIRLFAAFQRH